MLAGPSSTGGHEPPIAAIFIIPPTLVTVAVCIAIKKIASEALYFGSALAFDRRGFELAYLDTSLTPVKSMKILRPNTSNRLIVGCGFLGWPLAQQWTSARSPGSNDAVSQRVFATTRSATRAQQFADQGLQPVIADITKTETLSQSLQSLPPMDTIVFAVGMDRSQYDDIYDVYVEGLRRFITHYPHQIEHLIYISSTGVYGDFEGAWVDENTATQPAREGGKACLAAEALLAQSTDRWTVLRMAGLYGGDRVPTKSLIQQRNWDRLSPHGYLNLIHQHDAVNVIDVASQTRPFGETILCSDGNPPIRKDYYQYIADHFDLGKIPWPDDAAPDPNSRSANSKRISNEKMLRLLNIKLKHSDFKSGLAASGIQSSPT